MFVRNGHAVGSILHREVKEKPEAKPTAKTAAPKAEGEKPAAKASSASK